MAAGQGLAIGAIAQAVLAAVQAHYGASDVTLPERQIIAAGQGRLIAWDGEQLSVALERVGAGQAPGQGAGPARAGNPVSTVGLRHAVFTVQLVRCAPESQDGETPPPAADVTAAGLAIMRDAGLLSQALVEACTRVRANLQGPIQGQIVAGPVETIGPLGGLAAVESTITVTAGNLT